MPMTGLVWGWEWDLIRRGLVMMWVGVAMVLVQAVRREEKA
jgi:hypothetical protein